MDAARGTSLVSENGMSKQNQDCLGGLVRLCAVMSSSNLSQPNIVRSHGLRLLSLLTEIDGEDNPSILDFDAFGLLVALTFCAPSLFNGDQAAQLPLGNVQDQHLLRLPEIAKLKFKLIHRIFFCCPDLFHFTSQDRCLNKGNSSKNSIF